MQWYEKWFNDYYLKVYQHRNNEDAERAINFLKEFLPKGNSDFKIFDLCCGSGRHSIQLAKLGFSVTGIDLSQALLDEAVRQAEAENVKVGFQKFDAREIPFENKFDFGINLFTSFGYFDNSDEDLRQLKAFHKALKPNATFVIDFINHGYLRKSLVLQDTKIINEMKVIQKRKIQNNRIVKNIIIQQDGEEHEFQESVRLYTLQELLDLCDEANFKGDFVFGDFDKSDYVLEKSKRMIVVGKKV
ncbi:MAG: class I SAM-dependent methyltransferase [Calditrichaeota bacterium]|nr:MAG: class I SAM-dependent methyltransferase [Calditrichota bacterium]